MTNDKEGVLAQGVVVEQTGEGRLLHEGNLSRASAVAR
jgi:hypothetical protein